MTLVNLSESGYSSSSIDLLKRAVRIGERKEQRSLRIAGLILYMSEALFGLIFFIIFSVSFCVMCLSVKGGGVVSSSSFSRSSSFSCLLGIVLAVLPPIVM